MNSAGAGEHEQNRYRTTEDNFREDHFGLIRLFEKEGKQMLSLHIVDIEGTEVVSEVIPLDRLKNLRIRMCCDLHASAVRSQVGSSPSSGFLEGLRVPLQTRSDHFRVS